MSKQFRNTPEINRKSFIRTAFVIGTAFILLCSIYDAFLVYKYRAVINELNPICNWLIKLEPNHVSVFLFAKISCSLAVVSVLGVLFRFRPASGFCAMSSLVLFQVGLMGFLHFNEPIARFQNDNALVAFFSPNHSSKSTAKNNRSASNTTTVDWTMERNNSNAVTVHNGAGRRRFDRGRGPRQRKNRRMRMLMQKYSDVNSHVGPRKRVN